MVIPRIALAWLLALPAAAQPLSVTLRSRTETFRGSLEWQEVAVPYRLEPRRTALIICDVWDNHWCRGATQRVGLLAPKIAKLAEAARPRGILIVHAPSETMNFYQNTPQRKAILAFPAVEPPPPLALSSPPLPIDDSDGGCDTPGDKTHQAWSRQHAAIRIAEQDLVSDKGAEVYNALQARGIDHLLITGVHTNMCILNRTFAIKQMTRWGKKCILVRDLTDAMYDPQDRPYVSHAQGTELVIQHIEKYWCPTVLSADLLRALSGK